ncbi:hypothetical protein [Nostoc sp. 'Lobaria pulmonaria (5183) cyanobiont']|uniref:hypothetical protein n=1 Tax=Nostoc sp. 'Lobaria pulmonaria (5183) cyanobiont' TaxID=1618022 RepID=UPI000CF30FBA|nr:hypothetical protein [Nostoc sp. 'Lobaria pulmonaria (5183) cyanobiont']AVH73833.1 hypothetical protein NLP_5535 [Nostoc sp. 'Lobaria pulmonaria (5183) cyanobiont']
MQVTTITYQRVLNLGDYNSARLEKTAVIPDDYEDHEVATQIIIESVERQIHEEHIHNQLDKEIRDRKKELAALKAEYKALQKELGILNEQNLVDNLILNAGGAASDDPADF